MAEISTFRRYLLSRLARAGARVHNMARDSPSHEDVAAGAGRRRFRRTPLDRRFHLRYDSNYRWDCLLHVRGDVGPGTTDDPISTANASLFFFELTWKSIWLLAVALPLWSAHQMYAAPAQTTNECLMAAIFPIVIPWRYVFDNYLKKS
jgi:hypothetical protein